MINEKAPGRGFRHESPPINQLVNRPAKFNSHSWESLIRWQTIVSVEIASPRPRGRRENMGEIIFSEPGKGTKDSLGLGWGARRGGGNVIMGLRACSA